MLNRQLKFALPLSVVQEKDSVYLVAGEDLRYSLEGSNVETWLPELLQSVKSGRSVAEILESVPENTHQHALTVLEQLVEERVIVDALPEEQSEQTTYLPVLHGKGHLQQIVAADIKREEFQETATQELHILCQDSLNYRELREFSNQRRKNQTASLWISIGPISRAFVGPILQPSTSPCLCCLLESFRKRSPMVELHDALVFGKALTMIADSGIDRSFLSLVSAFALHKLSLLSEPLSPTPHRLHVLERSTLEASSHRVFVDAHCPECSQ